MRSLLPLLFAFSLFAKDVGGAVVFVYHRFGDSRYPSTNITKEQFEFQLRYLKENHYNVIPLSKVVRLLQKVKKIPPKTVCLTIDDAYKSVYTNGYPLMKKYGFVATIFVNTAPIDHHSKNYMSWEEMRKMQKEGFEFGNHSKYHPFLLSYLDLPQKQFEKKVFVEIEGAQKRLHAELGKECNENPRLFAYPFGEYTNRIKAYVRKLGYVGVAQNSGVVSEYSDLGGLPRYPMSQKFATQKGFLLKLHTKPMPIHPDNMQDHLVTNNPPKLFLHLEKPLRNVGCFVASGERIKVEREDETTLKLQAKAPLNPPRDHYTCTAKAKDGSWYWYSFLWVFKTK